jgi:hypothetical protein
MFSFDERIAKLRGKPFVPPTPTGRPPGIPEPRIHSLELRVTDRAEADLCDMLAEHFRAQGWDIWFEVPLGNGRPDIIGIRDDQTMGIEAKRLDIDGVIKQGFRLIPFVDLAYVALPLEAASAVELQLTRSHSGGPDRIFRSFGVLSVGRKIDELRHPTARPSRRVATAELRHLAELHGADRGGVSGGDFTPRNIRLWGEFASGRTIEELASEHNLSQQVVRTGLRRLLRWHEHLVECPDATACEEPAFAAAHRNTEAVAALPDLSKATLRRLVPR